MKNHHLRARLPDDEYLKLKEDADAEGLTLSEHVRNALLRDRVSFSQEQFMARIDAKLAAIPQSSATADTEINLEPLVVETVLLIRELVAERNAQILGRIAHQLNVLYPERKKL